MKHGVLAFGVFVAVGIAVVAAACGRTRTVTKTVTVGAERRGPGAPREVVLFGHVKSLTRKGGRFELRFDPAWFLSGVTAERAAVEDKVLQPGEPVPNDNYIVEEGHRLLTYVVPATAHVTVVTRGTPATTAITVSELAQIVKGKNPKHRPLFAPGNGLGFWIRVGNKYPNPVLSLDQQYQP